MDGGCNPEFISFNRMCELMPNTVQRNKQFTVKLHNCTEKS